MTEKEVLTNLRNHENAWKWQKYPLSKEEADVIIPLLEAVVYSGKYEYVEENAQSLSKLMDAVKR